MSRRATTVAALVGLISAGCVENTAPGNDRESALEPPSEPAPVASAASAIEGVAPHLLRLEIMTDADLAAAPRAGEEPCRFRYTRVGYPVLLYGSSAVAKVNGKLVSLDGAGDGRYESGGIRVSVEPPGEERTAGGTFEARMIVRLPGAPNELGFDGFSDC